MTAGPGETDSFTRHFGHVVYPDRGLSVFRSGTPQFGDYPSLWAEARHSALGVIVAVDEHRPAHADPALTYSELEELPHVVAVRADAAVASAPDGIPVLGPNAMTVTNDVPTLICQDFDHAAAAEVLRTIAVHACGHDAGNEG